MSKRTVEIESASEHTACGEFCLRGMHKMARISGLIFLAFHTAVAAQVPSWQQDVRPVFAKHCIGCHSGPDSANGLSLETRKAMLAGGRTGPAMSPGSLRDSLIWSFIATDKMPAEGAKLSAAEKTLIRRWILAGGPDSAGDAAAVAKAGVSAESLETSTPEKAGREVTTAAIDSEIRKGLKASLTPPSEGCDDATFMRRIYLDLNGRVPSFSETIRFLQDDSADKRRRLIDERLDAAEFGQHMAIIWHRLLIPKSAGAYERIPHRKFREWLSGNFNSNRPWDEVVSELVTAEGYLPSNKDTANNRKKDSKLQPQNIATSFINVHNTEGRPQPKGIVASVSRLFLAQSIECAQCHNHPMAKWEQTDFWAAAAFFERVRYERAVYGDTSIGRLVEPSEGQDLVYEDKAKGRFSFVSGVPNGPVIDLQDPNGQATGQLIRAKFLDGKQPQLDEDQSLRKPFAQWLTSPQNPWFAKAMVNRLWSQLLGRGFVEPVDDMAEDNPPSHPALLNRLAGEFVATDFDVKHLVRCICNSQTYQRSSIPADPEDPAPADLFAHQSLRQMTAEQLILSLETVLPTFKEALKEDAEDKNPGLFRKAFLEIHETGDGPLTDHTRGLRQALRMMNGDGKLFNRDAVQSFVGSDNSVEQNVRSVYLQALNRPPSDQELLRMTRFVEQAYQEISELDPKRLPQPRKDRPDAHPDPYADLIWVLLNSGEFIFNH